MSSNLFWEMNRSSSTKEIIDIGMLRFLDSFLKCKEKGKDKEQTLGQLWYLLWTWGMRNCSICSWFFYQWGSWWRIWVDLNFNPSSWLRWMKSFAVTWNWSLLPITFLMSLPNVLRSMIGQNDLGWSYDCLLGLGITTVDDFLK